MVNIKDVKQNIEVKALLEAAETQMAVKGFTEHSFRHVGLVSNNAGLMLKNLGFSDREVELAQIAGYMHDIGNAINRVDHAHTGATLAYGILLRMGMDVNEAAQVLLAIGNHDEGTGTAVSNISAAVILADKSDVHRSRVRNTDFATFDIHDRVNYAVENSNITVNSEEKTALLELKIDTKICPLIDYFEIFLTRMTMNRRAANFLGLTFKLIINGTTLL